ncbi:MAG: putative lipid II flippase FtsW [Puniceicoccales bacterium]|jgi:cell division protein FtsW|nr:putative lipid II flippase FtsW [Puniceicoccales bacterium]
MEAKGRVFYLLLPIFFLNGIGLLALSSASLIFVNGVYLKKQIVAMILAWITCAIFAQIPLPWFFKQRTVLFALAFTGACLVLIPGIGHMTNGSRRWIHIPGFSIQVSEFVKIALVIWLAGYVRKNESYCINLFKGFLKPIGICGGLAFLVLCEPDYGTAFLMMSVALTLLFLFGTGLCHLSLFLAVGGISFLGLIFLSPIRLRRIISFFNVEEHRFDATYQLWQGILCFASGGLYGSGIGLGRQKLSYLPEAHTDFIFPIIGEEFGSLFAIIVIFGFLIFAILALVLLCPKQDSFVKALGFGAVLMITFQAIINIGVVTGCTPTKGIALPFISYGGSNLVAMYALAGLIINCLRSDDTLAVRNSGDETGSQNWLK